jgi:tetratricopeptide (TPR) repeat protein
MGFYGDKKPDSAALPALLESAVRGMEAGRFAEALLCLLEAEDETPERRFNLALCYMKAGDYQTAVNHLEKALLLIKKAPPRKGGPERSEAYKTLRTMEVNAESYLAPMDAVFPDAFPAQAAEDITMALIHGYKKCGLFDKAKALAAGLAGPEFAALRS